jgi:hypothetical protein
MGDVFIEGGFSAFFQKTSPERGTTKPNGVS